MPQLAREGWYWYCWDLVESAEVEGVAVVEGFEDYVDHCDDEDSVRWVGGSDWRSEGGGEGYGLTSRI